MKRKKKPTTKDIITAWNEARYELRQCVGHPGAGTILEYSGPVAKLAGMLSELAGHPRFWPEPRDFQAEQEEREERARERRRSEQAARDAGFDVGW